MTDASHASARSAGGTRADADAPAHTVEEWLSLIDARDREGEFLWSYDLASCALESFPDSVWLRYRAVLALARSAATDRALKLFREFGLNDRAEEDIAALSARLAKDYALAGQGGDRAVRAGVAAMLYEAIYRRTNGYYPAINAATMWLLAGRRADAEALARAALALARSDAPDSEVRAYYRDATIAEAALLLGDVDTARTELAGAVAHYTDDRAALAATRKQLRLVSTLTGLDASIVDVLAPPRIVHYTGHMIGRLVPQYETLIATGIAGYLHTHAPAFAYGSLASGADILFAEAALKRGIELHVILPCDDERFIATSVARAGRDWIQRFTRCRDAARTVTRASEDMVSSDDSGLQYASSVAMGMAITRSRQLDATVEQLAIWDGRARATAGAGTEADMAVWRRAGLTTHVINCPPGPDPLTAPAATDGSPGLTRSLRAFIFGDVKGFSKLTEDQLPRFIDAIMRPIARILDGYGAAVLARNTWGDGLFVVFRDGQTAARCALDLQDMLRGLDLPSLHLPAGLGLRIGGHAGPVFEVVDPVLRQPSFLGSHITRTARIEPKTPEGDVYVTEQFAALLALEPSLDLRAEYVGHLPAAKDYGAFRMYRLVRVRHDAGGPPS